MEMEMVSRRFGKSLNIFDVVSISAYRVSAV